MEESTGLEREGPPGRLYQRERDEVLGMCGCQSHERWGRRGAWSPSAQMEISSRPFLSWRPWNRRATEASYRIPVWMKSQEDLIQSLEVKKPVVRKGGVS